MATIRRPGAASAAVLIGLSASMVGAHLLAPEWSRRVGLDVWNFAAVGTDRRLAAEEGAEVEAWGEHCARRRAVADQIAARLIDRSAALATVAAELLELFRGDSGWQSALESHSPHLRDPRLLYARHAVHRVSCLLDHDPTQWEAVRERLEADYQELEAECGAAPKS